MSRIGKVPVKIPDGVEVQLSEGSITVKGPKGSLSQKILSDIKIDVNDKEKVLTVSSAYDDKKLRAQWGLHRILVNNMVIGVTSGFQKVLVIEGIGYKAELKGKKLSIAAGLSHTVLYEPREGVTLSLEGPLKVVISGIDKQAVGQAAAEIRKIRPPEPYKGKGIRYQGEHIHRKAGKTGIK